MIDNGLNRYTLYSTIMETLPPLLRTPDMKTMASDQAHQTLLSHKKTLPLKYRDSSKYRRRGTVNVLCEFVFRCNMALSETKLALEYFDSYFEESNPEIKLYILVRLLMEYGKKDDILRVIREAKEKGIKPRSSLSALVQHIEQHNTLPQYLT